MGASLALGGCGEKEEITSAPAPAETPGAQPETSTTPAPAEADPRPAAPEDRPARPGERPQAGAAGRSPEDQQGGAGDETAARSQAMFTGRRGRVSPRLVRVPPFIAIRVELRSADGRRYSLSGAGKTLRTGGRMAAATFDGLRPERRLTLRGTGGRVVVEASAEPGP